MNRELGGEEIAELRDPQGIRGPPETTTNRKLRQEADGEM
jgi:hypothetical protein